VREKPNRRFHALFDKVARSDILCRAWDEVRANRGAPGADGVTIDAVEASGVAALLGQLAAEVRTGVYRPAPLRRVHLPKPGLPRVTPPLGISTVRDRTEIGLQPRARKLPDASYDRPREAPQLHMPCHV